MFFPPSKLRLCHIAAARHLLSSFSHAQPETRSDRADGLHKFFYFDIFCLCCHSCSGRKWQDVCCLPLLQKCLNQITSDHIEIIIKSLYYHKNNSCNGMKPSETEDGAQTEVFSADDDGQDEQWRRRRRNCKKKKRVRLGLCVLCV